MTDLSTSSTPAGGDLPRRFLRQGPQSGRFGVCVHRGVKYARLPVAQIETILRRIGRCEKSRGEVHVIVVDDRQMHDLNRRYRNRDHTTDVLAFPLTDKTTLIVGDHLLGEVYCNYDHARRWRTENGGTVADELVRLAVHGCLHLLGYDHHTPRERKRMVIAEKHHLPAAGLIDRQIRYPRPRPTTTPGGAHRG